VNEVSRRAVLGGVAAGALGAALPPTPDTGTTGDGIDRPGFLADADLVWQRMPTAWYEGPFLGNGFLGSGIYAEPGADAVRSTLWCRKFCHRSELGDSQRRCVA